MNTGLTSLGILLLGGVLMLVSYTSYRVAAACYGSLVAKGEMLAGASAVLAFVASFVVTFLAIALALSLVIPFGR